MTNRQATAAYLYALNDLPETRPGNLARLARLADSMASDAFDRRDYGGFNQPSGDAMMSVETALFVALCEANDVDWRVIAA